MIIIIMRSKLREAIAAAGLAYALLVSSPAAAQTYRVVALDPTWHVSDITNDLAMIGFGAESIPFIADRSGVRYFPGELVGALTLSDTGIISGTRFEVSGPLRAFRIKLDGTVYSEAVLGYVPSMFFVLAAADNGTLLISHSVHTLTPPHSLFVGYEIWDGVRVLPLGDRYVLPSGAILGDMARDETIGGSVDDRPFVQRPGEALVRPWSGRGAVYRIGSGGHVLGSADGRVVVRRPDGSMQEFPDLDLRLSGGLNALGDFTGALWNQSAARTEAFVARDGRVILLNDFFASAGEYLSDASHITDNGVILARVQNIASFDSFRYVLLVPTAAAPTGLRGAIAGGVVSLSWQPSAGATEYIVEAGTAPGLSNVFTGSVGLATSISGSVPAGRYYARVRARDIGGLSGPSEEVVIDVP